jgi:hypothetical protein
MITYNALFHFLSASVGQTAPAGKNHLSFFSASVSALCSFKSTLINIYDLFMINNA